MLQQTDKKGGYLPRHADIMGSFHNTSYATMCWYSQNRYPESEASEPNPAPHLTLPTPERPTVGVIRVAVGREAHEGVILGCPEVKCGPRVVAEFRRLDISGQIQVDLDSGRIRRLVRAQILFSASAFSHLVLSSGIRHIKREARDVLFEGGPDGTAGANSTEVFATILQQLQF